MQELEYNDEILSLREITLEYLKYNEISLLKMAKKTKIPRTSLYNWMHENRELDAHSISKIKDFLGNKYYVPVRLVIANLIMKKDVEREEQNNAE